MSGSTSRFCLLAIATEIALLSSAHPLVHVLSIAMALLLWATLFTRSTIKLSTQLVVALLIINMATAVIAKPTDSRDVYAYNFYGRVLAHYHHNPYQVTPSQLPHDAIAKHVAPYWAHTPSVYGPVFTAISTAFAFVTKTSPLAGRLFYQLFAALCCLAVALALRRRGYSSRIYFGFLSQPIILISVINGGHNDALLALFLTLGILSAQKQETKSALVWLALATLVKIAAGLSLVAFLLYAINRQDKKQSVCALLTGALSLAAYLILAPHSLSALNTASHLTSQGSIYAALARIFHHRKFFNSTLARYGLFAVTWITLLTLARKQSAEQLIILTITAFLLLTPYVLPWYFSWVFVFLIIQTNLTTMSIYTTASLLFVGYLDKPHWALGALHSTLHGTLTVITPLAAAITTMLLIRTTKNANVFFPSSDTQNSPAAK